MAAAASTVKSRQLERCALEIKMGMFRGTASSGAQDEDQANYKVMVGSSDYSSTSNHVINKYQLKIKDLSANDVKLVKLISHSTTTTTTTTTTTILTEQPKQNLRHEPAAAPPSSSSSSPFPACGRTLQPLPPEPPTSRHPSITLQLIHPQDLRLRSSPPRSPLKLQQNLHDPHEESLNLIISSPWQLQQPHLEPHAQSVSSPKSSSKVPHRLKEREDMRTSPCRQQLSLQERETEEEEEEPSKLQESHQNLVDLELALSEQCKLHHSTLQEEEKSWARSAWKMQKKEKKAGTKWDVEKMECECCGMEEECTRGYEDRVRGELCGHWLCGLCGEAVREERKRLGGAGAVSMKAALAAHMQPCRGFSRRARSKACPPASDVAVPHAVCRLLRRHLSTPSDSPRLPSSLPRCSSCLPKNV